MTLKRAKKQYTYAYIYSEQDNKDLTYFIDFSIRRIILALSEFKEYVKSLEDENKSIDVLIGRNITLNDRQKQIIYFLIKDVTNFISELSHRTMNGISRNTARSDIKKLLNENLVVAQKEGRTVKYYASEKLIKMAGGKVDELQRVDGGYASNDDSSQQVLFDEDIL